jgi:glycosyltransferase involved in cell wall biosynthesis
LPRTVIISWGVSSFFGWGVYGLNLALAWANDPEISLACAVPVRPGDLAIDPLRARALAPFMQASANLRAQLDAWQGDRVTAQAPLLASLDHNFALPRSHRVAMSGRPTLGVTFFETARLDEQALGAARAYPLIVTGSRWNEQVLRAHGLTHVKTILQGVDPSLFHPAPRSEISSGRFLVFSGGKLEPRKGQDIALVAFRRFAERHPDALLVAAWHSPWPRFAKGVDASGLAAPVAFDGEGKLDVNAWAAANGVRPENFLDAGQTPNTLMPQLYRQMDVGLFTNRCEGGTNLVAMELMACGVPAILSANSGHLDLIEEDNCYVLSRQGPVTFEPAAGAFGEVSGWGESDVDEAVELLERAYAERAEARARGERGARTLSRLTWAATAAQMKAAIVEACD